MPQLTFPYFSLPSHTSTSGRGRRIHILIFFFSVFCDAKGYVNNTTQSTQSGIAELNASLSHQCSEKSNPPLLPLPHYIPISKVPLAAEALKGRIESEGTLKLLPNPTSCKKRGLCKYSFFNTGGECSHPPGNR